MQLRGFPTRWVAVLLLLSSTALIATVAAGQTPAPAAPTPAQAPPKPPAATTGIPPAAKVKTWTGDFDAMVKRRAIRVLVPYSKTFYFVDRAVQRGLSYEVTQFLEADLNKRLKTGNIKVHVVCIPVTPGRDEPGPAREPRDIAMGNPTITPSA